MSNYAASGGYYISAPADRIVADSMTITGSVSSTHTTREREREREIICFTV